MKNEAVNDIPAELQIPPDFSTPVLVASAIAALLMILLSWRARRQYLALPLLEPHRAGPAPLSCAIVSADGRAPDGDSEWFAFVHPLARLEPGLPARLAACAAAHGLDAAAVLAPPPGAGFRQRATAPFSLAIHFAGLTAARINDARRAEALLPPGCVVLRRSACAFFGGPRAVSLALHDAPSFARRLKRHRVSYRLLRAPASGFALPAPTHDYIVSSPGPGAILAFAAAVSACWPPLLAALLYCRLWPEAALFAALPCAAYLPWYPGWRDALLAPAGLVLFHLSTPPSLLAAFLAQPKEPAPGS